MPEPINAALTLDTGQALRAIARLESELERALNKPLKLTAGTGAGKSSGVTTLQRDLKAATSEADRFARKLREIGAVKIGGPGMVGAKLPIGPMSMLADKTKIAATNTVSLAKRYEALQDKGAGLRRLGDVMSASITLPATLAAKAILSLTTTFDSFVMKSVNLANLAVEDIDKVSEALLAMAPAVGRGPKELAEAFYFIESSGVIKSTAEALELTEMAAKGAAIGLGTSTDVAKLLTTQIAAFGDELGSPTRALEVLIETVRQGKAEPQELVTNFGRAIPLIKQAGISAEEGAGAIAYLSRETNSASQATTFFINFLNKLVAPSKGANEAAQELGFTFEQLQDIFSEQGFAAGIEFLRQRVDVQSASFKKLFPEIRAASGATLLLTADQQNLGGTIDAVAQKTGQVAEAFNRLQKTESQKLNEAKAELEAAAINLGTTVVPSIVSLVGLLADLASGFAALPTPVIAVTAALVGVLAAMGPIYAAGGRLLHSFGLIGGAAVKMGAQVGLGAATATGAMAAAHTAMTGFAVTAGLALAGLAAFKIVEHFRSAGQEADRLKKEVDDLSAAAAQNADIVGDQGAAYEKSTTLVLRYGDAIREATKAALEQKLADKDQTDDIDRIGYSIDELTDKLDVYGDAQKGLSDVTKRAVRQQEIQVKTYQYVDGAVQEQVLSTAEAIAAIDKYGVATLMAGRDLNNFAGAVGFYIDGNKDLIETLAEQAEVSTTALAKTKELALAGEANYAAALKQSDIFKTLTIREKQLVEGVLAHAAAMSDAELETAGYETSLNDTEGALDGVGDAAGDAADEVKDLRRSLEELASPGLNAAQIALDLVANMEELKQGFIAAQGKLDDPRLFNPLSERITLLMDQANSQLANGFDPDEIAANWSRDIRGALAEAGLDTEEEVQAFSQFLNIPLDITVATKLDGEEYFSFVTSVEENEINAPVTADPSEFESIMNRITTTSWGVPVLLDPDSTQLDAELRRQRFVTVQLKTSGNLARIKNPDSGLPITREAMGGATDPHMARDGQNLFKYAEPGTGGEAFIPLANDRRRQRAVGITQAVARKFGYDMVPMADGGLLSDSMNEALGKSFESALEPAVNRAAGAVRKGASVQLVAEAFAALISKTIASFLESSSIDFGPVSFLDDAGKSTIASSLSEAVTGALGSSIDKALEPAVETAAKRLQKTTAVELMAQKLQVLMESTLNQFFSAAENIGQVSFIADDGKTSLISQVLSEGVLSALTTAFEKTVEPALGTAATRTQATPIVEMAAQKLQSLMTTTLEQFFSQVDNLGDIPFLDDETKNSLIGKILSEGVVAAVATTFEKTIEPALGTAATRVQMTPIVEMAALKLQSLMKTTLEQFFTAVDSIGRVSFKEDEGKVDLISQTLSGGILGALSATFEKALAPMVNAAAAGVDNTYLSAMLERNLSRLMTTTLNDFFIAAQEIGPITFKQDDGKISRISQALSDGVLGALSTTFETALEPVIKKASAGALSGPQIAGATAQFQHLVNQALEQFITSSLEVGQLSFHDAEGGSLLAQQLGSTVVGAVGQVLDNALAPAIEQAGARVSASTLLPGAVDALERLATEMVSRVASISAQDIEALFTNSAPISSSDAGAATSPGLDNAAIVSAIANLEAAYKAGGGGMNVAIDNHGGNPLDEQRLAALLARSQRMAGYAG